VGVCNISRRTDEDSVSFTRYNDCVRVRIADFLSLRLCQNGGSVDTRPHNDFRDARIQRYVKKIYYYHDRDDLVGEHNGNRCAKGVFGESQREILNTHS